MLRPGSHVVIVVGLTAFIAVSCGGKSSPASPSTSGLPTVLAFSNVPVDLSALDSIIPLGNLNPPDHSIPTNHEYFSPTTGARTPVVAPAAGNVLRVSHGADDSVDVQTTANAWYYLAHLLLDTGIVPGATLAAGQRLGVTSGITFDFGLVNSAVTLFFVRPERYIEATIHADSPLKYFSEPTRSALYAKVKRAGADKDGKIDFDQAGRLSGNWFADGLAVSESENVANGPQRLAFAQFVQDPTTWVISIGGAPGVTGVFTITGGAPTPDTVTTANGLVSYPLTGRGAFLVQMTAADRLRAEYFAGAASASAFTGAAMTYVR